MTDHIQQAADVISASAKQYGPLQHASYARALAAAGLLVTPEQQAVLDAALVHRSAPGSDGFAVTYNAFAVAVDALLAATPKDGER